MGRSGWTVGGGGGWDGNGRHLLGLLSGGKRLRKQFRGRSMGKQKVDWGRTSRLFRGVEVGIIVRFDRLIFPRFELICPIP